MTLSSSHPQRPRSQVSPLMGVGLRMWTHFLGTGFSPQQGVCGFPRNVVAASPVHPPWWPPPHPAPSCLSLPLAVSRRPTSGSSPQPHAYQPPSLWPSLLPSPAPGRSPQSDLGQCRPTACISVPSLLISAVQNPRPLGLRRSGMELPRDLAPLLLGICVDRSCHHPALK